MILGNVVDRGKRSAIFLQMAALKAFQPAQTCAESRRNFDEVQWCLEIPT